MKKFLGLILLYCSVIGAQVVPLPSNIQIKNIPSGVNANDAYLNANKLHYAGTWASGTQYNQSDTVLYSGNTYVLIQTTSTGNQPDISGSYWVAIGGNSGGSGSTGSAGGDLGGTYPNPTVQQIQGATIPATSLFIGTNGSRQIVSTGSLTGQTSHQVMGTCAGATSFAPCSLALTDLPGSILNSGGSYTDPMWLSLTWAGGRITGITPETNGGTGANNTPGAAGHYLRSNGTHYLDNTIQVGDIPQLNQNTTGTAAALAGTPTLCATGQAPTGILANGNATACASLAGGSGITAITGDLTASGAGSVVGTVLQARGGLITFNSDGSVSTGIGSAADGYVSLSGKTSGTAAKITVADTIGTPVLTIPAGATTANLVGVTGSPSNNDCAKLVVSGGVVTSLTTNGGACGSGGAATPFTNVFACTTSSIGSCTSTTQDGTGLTWAACAGSGGSLTPTGGQAFSTITVGVSYCTTSWQVPSGVNWVFVQSWGAGAGGGGSDAGTPGSAGPGGSGGGYAEFLCPVTPGATPTIQIGIGGVGNGPARGNISPGGSSSFSGCIGATGGDFYNGGGKFQTSYSGGVPLYNGFPLAGSGAKSSSLADQIMVSYGLWAAFAVGASGLESGVWTGGVWSNTSQTQAPSSFNKEYGGYAGTGLVSTNGNGQFGGSAMFGGGGGGAGAVGVSGTVGTGGPSLYGGIGGNGGINGTPCTTGTAPGGGGGGAYAATSGNGTGCAGANGVVKVSYVQ